MPASSAVYIDLLENRRLFAAMNVIDSDRYALSDINNDQKSDLVMPTENGVRILLGSGDGTFAPARTIALPGTPRLLLSGDFDGDGDVDGADFVVSFDDGTAGILLNVGPTTQTIIADDPFTGLELQDAPGDAFESGDIGMIVGDWDGDGRDDLGVADQRRGIIAILIGLFQSGQTFAAPVTIPSPFGAGVRVAAGDVTGDGFADLLGLDRRGKIHLAVNGGGVGVWDDTDIVHVLADAQLAASGRFDDTDIVHIFPPRVRVDRVAVGDVNGDGTADIVAFADGRVRAGFITDTATHVEVRSAALAQVPQALQHGVAVGDINGDGLDDLLVLTRTADGILPYVEFSD